MTARKKNDRNVAWDHEGADGVNNRKIRREKRMRGAH